MKLHVVALMAAAVAGAAAQHHHHGHAHLHRNHARAVTPRSVDATVLAFELDGKTISEQAVKEGIANGSLVFAKGVTNPFSLTSANNASPVTTHVSAAVTPAVTPVITASSPGFLIASAADTAVPAPTAVSPGSYSSVDTSNSLSGTGLDKDFPDGQLACSDFPDQFGAINLDWLKLGGWAGIQKGQMTAGGYANIETMVPDQCTNGNCCIEGAYCSYACPAGYQKSQWPQKQGATGQSIGGIQCKNGKLWLTNKALSSKLCMPGAQEVAVKVSNKMSENVAICRTDYPGTESQTVPLDALPGTTQNITCPEKAKYYQWQGKPTSAQYYVNPKGVPVADACQWATPGSKIGNFAPLNIGVGYDGNVAWVSIFQNAPTTDAKLEYSVEITGSSVSGKCRYQNGQYCSGNNYETCNSQGCTSSAASGEVTFVLSN